MRSKYIGSVVNGFLVLDSYCKVGTSGSRVSYFAVRCICCGEVSERARANVLAGEAACKCSYKYRNHNVQGMSNTRLNRVYRSLIERCENPKCKSYKYYGGRGISVCEEWRRDFRSFYEWSVANGYREEVLANGKNRLTIDRIDNDGNYEPSNCRWVPMSVQCQNRRRSKKQ